MHVRLFLIFSSFSCSTNTFASLNSSTSEPTKALYPLSIPPPLLPYFESVSNASEWRQPRQEMPLQVEVDLDDNQVEESTSPDPALENDWGSKIESLGLRMPAVVREHYMPGRSGRQIVPGVYSCGHQVNVNLNKNYEVFSLGERPVHQLHKSTLPKVMKHSPDYMSFFSTAVGVVVITVIHSSPHFLLLKPIDHVATLL